MKKKTKKKILTGVIVVLSVSAVTLSALTAVSAIKNNNSNNIDTDNSVEAQMDNYIIEEATLADTIDLDGELKRNIEPIISDIKAQCGGEWSVYIYVPESGSTLSINQRKMQAASVIKLFVMGAVYDEYDDITEKYGKEVIDEWLELMITVSSNEGADELIGMLGRGDYKAGRKKVNDFCKSVGLENTVMDRLMEEDNIERDNYTTTEDTGRFLDMVLSGKFKHSKDMIKLLEAQTRKTKIPSGVPTSVMTANKTGELDDVENDAAIVFAGKPYIICVMSDGVNDYQPPIDAISNISRETYNYLAPKLAYSADTEE